MNNFLRVTLFILCYFVVNTSLAQSYIVEFQSEKSANEFFNQSKNAVLDIDKISRISPIYNIYANALKELEFVSLLSDTRVLRYLKDEKVQKRETPNDNHYPQQWALPLINAEKAWDLVDQGKTINNHEIVIAVLDDAFQIDHPDLINNIWTNDGEIPNDNIDNDGNGYIDDYYGLHMVTGDDQHPVGTHGTKVAGIVGAEGNNAMGISGVNWNIKLMILSGAVAISDIIEGYEYVRYQRKLFNDTNGAEGSFVVATNFSAGIPYAWGFNYESWCSEYDRLGEVGIISVTTTDNDEYDVDVEGDMPTTCQSEFTISTTSTTRFDTKAMFAAYGEVNIDIGSPGEDTFSTTTEGGYAEFTGTSAAAPHVAGAIEQVLMSSAVPISTLTNRSVTGGRLDIFNALTMLADVCNNGMISSREKLEFINIGPNPVIDNFTFQYDFAKFVDHEIKIYNTIGQLVYTETITPSLFVKSIATLNLENLIQGMYLLNFSDGENNLTWKFFKE